MGLKREVLATAQVPAELLERQKEKATELNLLEPQGDARNNWGPVYSNADYDLRIDKKTGMEEYELHLLHKLKPPVTLRDRLRRS